MAALNAKGSYEHASLNNCPSVKAGESQLGQCKNPSQTENQSTLLAFTAFSAAQSSAQTHIQQGAIVVIDTSNNA